MNIAGSILAHTDVETRPSICCAFTTSSIESAFNLFPGGRSQGYGISIPPSGRARLYIGDIAYYQALLVRNDEKEVFFTLYDFVQYRVTGFIVSSFLTFEKHSRKKSGRENSKYWYHARFLLKASC